MEFKVWVDGIQKIVCGVKSDTTCQDVVLALASAMGQTGCFSLMEKWRDYQRALIPTESPLQSLHKWGEYSREVRYLLVQKRTENAGQQVISNNRFNAREYMMHTSLCSLNQFKTSQHNLYPSGSGTVKRSSTFSGAHKSTYETLPSSLTQSSSSVTPSQHNVNQQTVPPSLVSTTGGYQCDFVSTTSGGSDGLLLGPFTKLPFPKSSSTTVILEDDTTIKTLADSHLDQSATYVSDSKELHPANKPEALSPNVSHNGEYSPASPHRNYQPTNSKFVHSKQMISQQKIQISNQAELQQPLITSSKQSHQTSSMSQLSTAPTESPRPYQSHQTHLPLSFHIPCHQSSQSQQQPHPVPAPRHHTVLTSPASDQEAIVTETHKSPQLRNTINSHKFSTSFFGCKENISNLTNNGNIESIPEANIYNCHHSKSGQGGTVLNNKNCISELTSQQDHVPDCVSVQTMDTSENSIKRQPETKTISEFYVTNKVDKVKYATLDRHFMRSKPSLGLPIRSLSTDAETDEHKRLEERQVSKFQSASDIVKLQQDVGEKKISYLTSSMKKEQGSIEDGSSKKKISSFASAVAHVRKQSGNDAFTKSKSGSYLRQHSLDSCQNDVPFKGKLGMNSVLSIQRQYSFDNSRNVFIAHNSNQKNRNSPGLQLRNESSLTKASTSSQNNSSLTKMSQIMTHQESSSTLACVANNKNINNKQDSALYKISSSSSKEMDAEKQQHCTVSANSRTAVKDQQLVMAPEYSSCVGVIPSQIKEDYSQLLMMVKQQQEKIKEQEKQITDFSCEITGIEEATLKSKTNLETAVKEISRFEKQEALYKNELDNLDMTEWTDMEEKEKNLETELKLQLTNLKAELEVMESKILRLKEEECNKSSELNSEEQWKTQENKTNEELEEKATTEIKLLEVQLSRLNEITEENNHKLGHVDKEIHQMDVQLNLKEDEEKCLEEELKDESEPSQNLGHSTTPALTASDTAFPMTENGEAILKILEQRLSSPPSFTREDLDCLGGVLSAQHLYSSAIAAKNQNGIWV